MESAKNGRWIIPSGLGLTEAYIGKTYKNLLVRNHRASS